MLNVKRRIWASYQTHLNAPVHLHLPPTCICAEAINPQGDHLVKCRRGNEWDTRHTALTQCIASITQAAKLPVSLETTIAQLAPPVLETYGSFSKSLSAFLKLLAQELFRNATYSDPATEVNLKEKLLNLWKARISCVLQRANSRLLISKLSRTQQTIQRFSPTSLIDFSSSSAWSM